MRSKALLVGARASFEGPKVTLEEGLWLVGQIPFVEIEIVGRGIIVEEKVIGPCVIFARVLEGYIGKGIYLKAIQVKHGKNSSQRSDDGRERIHSVSSGEMENPPS